ncbi:MAG: TolC family protein, partial [Verrucomicrobiota bacterium]
MQDAREQLYLAALDVSEQRFRFDTRPSIFHNDERLVAGKDRPGGDRQEFDTIQELRLDRRLATGADFVFQLANSVLWDLTQGGVEPVVNSAIQVSLVQPLLRFRARSFVLENLTQSERTLVANVRRMQQFQQSFYIDVISGRRLSSGPSRGNAGGTNPPIIAGTPNSFGGNGGFLGLLQARQQIRNQESSVAALRDSLAQLQAAFEAGRIRNRLQVDQARQALYNGQSRLLTSRASFESSLDRFKVDIGLPPDLDAELDDGLLDPFNLVDPAISALQNRVADALDGMRNKGATDSTEELLRWTESVAGLESAALEQVERGRRDVNLLQAGLPERKRELERIQTSPQLKAAELDPDLFRSDFLEGLEKRLRKNLGEVDERLRAALKALRILGSVEIPPDQIERARSQIVEKTTELSSLLLELSLIQAAARLESVTLQSIDISYDHSLTLAEDLRLDWMNARARLMDSWRRIAVDAEALKSGLNLIVNGEIPTVGNSAEDFSRDSARLRFGLQFDSPLRRLQERNNYKEALLSYESARRDYMNYEDRVKQSLRNTLRIVELSQLNFEVRRAAVRVAVAQVDLARLRLNEPPKPGASGAQFGATTARDLVSALGDLL